MRYVHVLTPGDHFSPRTGSAIPTVVDGLCRHAPAGTPRPAVAVASGTYEERYDSADIVEYEQARPFRLPGPLQARHADAAAATLGLPRVFARREAAAVVARQDEWDPSVVIAHNLPQLPALVGHRHAAVCYAHNEILRHYRPREAGARLARVGAVVCVSEYLAGATEPHLPVALRNRLRVVRNGVDVAAFPRSVPVGTRETVHVAFVGRMIRDKGADVLIEAVRLLGRADIRLDVIGSAGFDAAAPLTPFEREVRQAAATLGGRVTVRPFTDRAGVAAALGAADVVVVPSRWPDPCPLTVMEGLAAGAAVIGARIGGIPEQLARAGILVESGDAAGLAGALEDLVADRDRLKRVAAECAAEARTHDWAWASRTLHSSLRDVE